MSRTNQSNSFHLCSFQQSVQNTTAVLLISEHSKIWGFYSKEGHIFLFNLLSVIHSMHAYCEYILSHHGLDMKVGLA